MINLTALKKNKGTVGVRLNRTLSTDILLLLFLCIAGTFMVLPLIYAVIQSLKPLDELFLFPPRFFVRRPTLNNFLDLFKVADNLWVPFGRYILNSIIVTFVVTVSHVVFASMAAYSLQFGTFIGRKFIFQIIILSLLFTSQVTGIMQYVLMSKVGMIDTYWSLTLPYIATPIGLFLMKQFMSQFPASLIEAARIDGAGILSIFGKIVMPNVKPAWLTITVFSFQGSWAITGGVNIYNESLKTLPTVLTQIASSGLARAGAGAASAVLLMLPPIILFFIVQRNIIQTMAHSGIKE